MQDLIIGGLVVVGACLAISICAILLVLFRPSARRRRRRKQNSRRPKIDLFAPSRSDDARHPDA